MAPPVKPDPNPTDERISGLKPGPAGPISIFSLTLEELCREFLHRFGKGRFHAAALYREVFKNGNRSFSRAPEFSRSKDLAHALVQEVRFPSFSLGRKQEHDVTKFAISFEDGCTVESVVIPCENRITLCVSSQAGCRMNCAFCATGAGGFARNLRTEEIVAQAWTAIHTLGFRINNVVFMGMGEPLDNTDNVVQSIMVMSDQQGMNIPQSRITVSTAGHADGIKKLGAYHLPLLKLAVSINAPDNALRNRLMPINKQYPLELLKERLLTFPLRKRGVFFIEYVLLAGINDSREAAYRLADFLEGLPIRVNLIIFNESPSINFKAPNEAQVKRFAAWLTEKNLFVRTRKSYGPNISAACGQLCLAC
jgi:23S rRNA (adenine2503-C2)-methyltransferase